MNGFGQDHCGELGCDGDGDGGKDDAWDCWNPPEGMTRQHPAVENRNA